VNCRARDRPEKALGIEIYNAHDYIRMRQYWNGCGLLLHELCHLIHQQVFGLDDPVIYALYQRASASGRYECVVRRDWILQERKDTITDRSYAMVDHKEFFAEMSVTYWATGYADLDHASMLDAAADRCSPPPSINDKTTKPMDGDNGNDLVAATSYNRTLQWFERTIWSLLPWSLSPSRHCNKFYPFTRGQLQSHDAPLEREMDALWQKIAEWEDPKEEQCCRRSSSSGGNLTSPGCWSRPCWKLQRPLLQIDQPVDESGPKTAMTGSITALTVVDDIVDL
jgi:hypothetical protein